MDSEPLPGLLTRLKHALLPNGKPQTPEDIEREIQDLVEQGEAQGLFGAKEGEMIEAVLELGETTAGQVMIPRTELCTVSHTASLNDIIPIILESGHSRLPVYGEDLDHIVGVLYAKDLLAFWDRPKEEHDLSSLIREPLFVPQSMPLNRLLSVFERRRTHLAVVVDEYGGTSGIVTMEDVLEQIVGNIEDEYDKSEELIVAEPDGSWLVDARMDVDELAEHLEMEIPEELPEGHFESVGGFVTTLMGRLPVVQEETTWGPLRLIVTGADQRRVTQVRIYRQTPEADSE